MTAKITSPKSTNTTTIQQEIPMEIAVAKKVAKPVAKKAPAKKTTPAAKKETTVTATAAPKKAPAKPAAKTSTPAAKAPAKKVTKPAVKTSTATAKKTPAVKDAPTPRKKPALKYFLVYKDIAGDVTARTANAKTFDPICYEGVLAGNGIADARKKLAEMKGEDYGQYDVVKSYDSYMLTQNALAKFDGATEKVAKLGKDTYRVTLRNIDGLEDYEIEELALYAWIVNAASKATKPTGNERMLDRDFDLSTKHLKDNRANVLIRAI